MAPTPRQRARAALVADIKDSALRQIASSGAQRLSLRAITRELGMVSSSLYRYFASRDELLTALLVDAYTDLAGALESAAARPGTPREQWQATCAALRSFARSEPHRFSLVYGTPIAGYQAPPDTIEPAARVVRALAAPVAAAHATGAQGADSPAGATTPGSDAAPPAEPLRSQLAVLNAVIEADLPARRAAHLAGAIAQLLGLLTLELGGHFVGTFEPADALYEDAVTQLAELLELG